MGEMSVFEFLMFLKDYRESPDVKDPNTCHALEEQYHAFNYDDKDPGDNIGDLIEKEAQERELDGLELELAKEYFAEDLRKSYHALNECIEQAQECGPVIHMGSAATQYLRRAGQLIMRAKKDMKRSVTLCPPETGMDRKSYCALWDRFNDLADIVQITWENPDCFVDIIPLHLRMKQAIRVEDYELAAQLRKGIEIIVSVKTGELFKNV
jgi:hypothetical protein